MRFDIATLFPHILEPYLDETILGRAREAKFIETRLWDIRQFATDKHKTVDDTPYGGGAGMVMKVEPIDRLLQEAGARKGTSGQKIVVMAARGKQFTQQMAQEYAKLDRLVFICGRYEGIDQRVADNLADEEVSVGPFVLAGGELPALIILEAVARLIPGVLGNPESLTEESHSMPIASLEYPQFTKPEEYNGWKVPDILLSGNHKAIQEWRNSRTLPKE